MAMEYDLTTINGALKALRKLGEKRRLCLAYTEAKERGIFVASSIGLACGEPLWVEPKCMEGDGKHPRFRVAVVYEFWAVDAVSAQEAVKGFTPLFAKVKSIEAKAIPSAEELRSQMKLLDKGKPR